MDLCNHIECPGLGPPLKNGGPFEKKREKKLVFGSTSINLLKVFLKSVYSTAEERLLSRGSE